MKLLEALSDFAAIALENARHVKRIHELTITDDCTTLYNARHMGFILDTEIYRSRPTIAAERPLGRMKCYDWLWPVVDCHEHAGRPRPRAVRELAMLC